MKTGHKTSHWPCMILVSLWSAGSLVADTNAFTLDLSLPEISIAKDANGNASFGKADIYPTPGMPAIPCSQYRILLPPDVDLHSVSIVIEAKKTHPLDGEWSVQPSQADVPTAGVPSAPHTATNQEVYAENRLFPADNLGRVQCGRIREWRFVDIEVYPVQFNPVGKQLVRLDRLTIRANYKQTGNVPVRTRSRITYLKYRQLMQRTAANLNQFASLYDQLSK
jgi:hypothetical protein